MASQVAGALESEAYSRISPFHQLPVIDDEGFVVAESAAIVLYLAQKAGKLIPSDVQGRTRVVQWCFAAMATISPSFQDLELLDIFDKENKKLRAELTKLAHRWLTDLERRLSDREWIACVVLDVNFTHPSCCLTSRCYVSAARAASFPDRADAGSLTL